MGGAFPLGRIGPIPLFIHWTAALLVFMAFSWSNGDTTVFAALLSNLVLGIVLHECGHGLTALLFKAKNVTITLWAFGGVCSSSYREGKPLQELAILIAGPAVSYALAAIGFAALLFAGPFIEPGSFIELFFRLLFGVNLILGLFNSVPLFPLDGGQIVFQFQRAIGVPLEIAKKISLTLALLCAAAVLAWMNWELIQGQPGASIDWFGVFLVLFLLQSSWSALRPQGSEG